MCAWLPLSLQLCVILHAGHTGGVTATRSRDAGPLPASGPAADAQDCSACCSRVVHCIRRAAHRICRDLAGGVNADTKRHLWYRNSLDISKQVHPSTMMKSILGVLLVSILIETYRTFYYRGAVVPMTKVWSYYR